MSLRYTMAGDALADVAAGRPIVLAGPRQADVVIAADHATPEAINFLARQVGGPVALALDAMRAEALGVAAPVSVDASGLEQPGFSAGGRAQTIRAVLDEHADPAALVSGGHVDLLPAHPAGVLGHAGRVEGAVDLARLAGRTAAAVICELLDEHGAVAGPVATADMCRRHGMRMLGAGDLVTHRHQHDRVIERIVATRLPTAFGDFEAIGYRSLSDGGEHLALTMGDVRGVDVLVRVHVGCGTGDVFRSLTCDCRRRLERAMAAIERHGRGVIIYLERDDTSGPCHDSAALSKVPGRIDSIGAQVLDDLGVRSVALLDDERRRVHGLQWHGVSVTRQVAA